MMNRHFKSVVAGLLLLVPSFKAMTQPLTHLTDTNIMYICWPAPCPDQRSWSFSHYTLRCDLPYIRTNAFNYLHSEQDEPCTLYGIAAPVCPAGESSTPLSFDGCTWYTGGTVKVMVYKATEGDSILTIVKSSEFSVPQGKEPDRRLVTPPGTLFMHEFWFNEPVTISGTFLVGMIGYPNIHVARFGVLANIEDECLIPGCLMDVDKNTHKIIGHEHDHGWNNGGLEYIYDSVFPDIEGENIRHRTGQFYFPIVAPGTGGGLVSVRDVAAASAVRLTPNPARTEVTVEAGSPVRAVEAVDMVGRTVLRKVFPGGESRAVLDISLLPQGCYALRVSTPQGTLTEKLVVE